MNRNLRQPNSSGSLDLMLDILCNVFGAVILIACLLAILPRHTAYPTLWPITEAENQMLERRVDFAQEEVGKMLLEIERLGGEVDPVVAALIARRESLQGTLEMLEEQVGELAASEETNADARAFLVLGKTSDLEEKLRRIREELARVKLLDYAGNEKAEFLDGRLKALRSQLTEMARARVSPVRFPKEKKKSGSPFPIIVKYGKIYPLEVGKALKRNPSIERTSTSETSFFATPIRARGDKLPAESASVSETLKAAKRLGCSVDAYVYEDSHGAFQDLKALMGATNLSYGLEFVPADKKMHFGDEGTSPPEL